MLDENQTMFDDGNIMIREKQTFDDNSDFHGEALPLLEDLFEKYIKSNVTGLDSQETENNHIFYFTKFRFHNLFCNTNNLNVITLYTFYWYF